jgi:hypothetical protein
MNTKFLQNDISNITIELLIEAITYSYVEGHNSYAPLGCGGDDFIMYGESRRKEISVRLHSGDVKLLVTDSIGGFLFHGGFDTGLLPISFIAKQYYDIIQNVKHLLDNTSKSLSITEHDKEQMFKQQITFLPLLHYCVL